MESNVENCVICQDPIDMSDRMTLGGAFQLIKCPHKYHRVCFNSHVEQYDNDEDVKCAICSRIVPLPEVVAATMKLQMPIVTDPRNSAPICDDSQQPVDLSPETSSLTGLFDNIDMSNRSPMQQDPPQSNNLPPSQREQVPGGPARPISPTRTLTEQNIQYLMNEAVRRYVESQQQSDSQEQSRQQSESSSVYEEDEEDPYGGMERYLDNGKPRCLNCTKTFPYPQCRNAASFPPHEPVDCATHFKSKVLGEDTKKIAEVKLKANMLRSISRSRKEKVKTTKIINESVPAIVQQSAKDEIELKTQLEKIESTDDVLNQYFKKISPPNSRGTSRSTTHGTNTPRPPRPPQRP